MRDPERRRSLRRGALAGTVVALFLVAFTAWQATQVRSSLVEVASRLTTASDDVAAGRLARAEAELASAAKASHEAQVHTRGPVWWTASKLPWVGDDVTAVRVVAEVADDLTSQTLPPLVEDGSKLGPEMLTPRRGRLDLEPLAAMAPPLQRSSEELRGHADRVAALETAGLVFPVRDQVVALQEKLDAAAGATTDAALAARVGPALLGAEGKRTYLMMFQNNAEVRAQGGMPGALALITARDGRVEMLSQSKPGEIGTFPDPFVELTSEEVALFTERMAVYPQDTVFVPDFPRGAQILKQMWEHGHPQQIDGVISVDPVALSYLLRGTGPVTLDNGTTLSADNAVSYLMNEVYVTESDAEQDRIFAQAARATFTALVAGRGNAFGLLEGLAQAAGERRLMVWSTRKAEQQELSGTSVAGELPTGAEGSTPEIGVYLNDSSADKLSYYLDYEVDVFPISCSSAGSQRMEVTATLRSTVPKDQELPASVVGPPTNTVPPGTMLNSVSLYAPAGGFIDEVSIGGEEVPVSELTYRGRDVATVTLPLSPGEKTVLDYSVYGAPGQTGDPRLLTTPVATGTGQGLVVSSVC